MNSTNPNWIQYDSIQFNSIKLNLMGTLTLLNPWEFFLFNSIEFNLRILIQLSCIQFNLHHKSSFNLIFIQMKLNFHKINSFFFISLSLVLWSIVEPKNYEITSNKSHSLIKDFLTIQGMHTNFLHFFSFDFFDFFLTKLFNIQKLLHLMSKHYKIAFVHHYSFWDFH
jgi:hypothetical protein